MSEFEHGTYSTYVNGKCRCPECKEAAAEYRRVKRATLMPDEAHGTITGYNYWRCDCRPCKQAGKDYRASLRTGVVPPGKKHGISGRRVYGCECAICGGAAKEASRAAYLRSKKGTGATISNKGDKVDVYWDGKHVGHAEVGRNGYTMYDATGDLIDLIPVLRYEFVDGIVGHARETGEIE